MEPEYRHNCKVLIQCYSRTHELGRVVWTRESSFETDPKSALWIWQRIRNAYGRWAFIVEAVYYDSVFCSYQKLNITQLKRFAKQQLDVQL
jgi:hypothetical protein